MHGTVNALVNNPTWKVLINIPELLSCKQRYAASLCFPLHFKVILHNTATCIVNKHRYERESTRAIQP